MYEDTGYELMQQKQKYERSGTYIIAQIIKFIMYYVIMLLKGLIKVFINVLRTIGIPIKG